MNWTLSIDFGTSSTIAVGSRADGTRELIEIDGDRRMPSVAFLDDDGTWVVGRSAVDLASGRPDRAVRVPKRRLGEQTPIVVGGRPVSAVSVCAEILRVAAAAATLQMGSEPSMVRLTYPATWNRPLRNKLLQAATEAGLATPTLIPEPVAAAHALPLDVPIGSHVAIYDLGGGTFDTTVVRKTDVGFTVVGRPTGDPAFGGELFDEIIRNDIGEQLDPDAWDELQVSDELPWRRSSVQLLAECKRVKEAMSSHRYGVVIASLPNGVTELRLDRERLDSLVAPFVDESVDVLARGIEQAGLTTDDIFVVHLVGGASRMPIVIERIREAFPGVRVEQLGDPRTAAALGAPLAEASSSQIQTFDGATPPAAHTSTAPPQTPPPQTPPPQTPPPQTPAPQTPAPAAQSAATHIPSAPVTPGAPPIGTNAPLPNAPAPSAPLPNAAAPSQGPTFSPLVGQQGPPSAGAPPTDTGGRRAGLIAMLVGAAIVAVFGIGALAAGFSGRNSADPGASTTSSVGSSPTGSTTSTVGATTSSATTSTTSEASTTTEQDGPTIADLREVQLRAGDFPEPWTAVLESPLPQPDCDLPDQPATVVVSDFAGWTTESPNESGDLVSIRIESEIHVYESSDAATAELERLRTVTRTCQQQSGVPGSGEVPFSIRILTLDDDAFIFGDKGQETFTMGRVYTNEETNAETYVIGNHTRVGRSILTIWVRSPFAVTQAQIDTFSDVSFPVIQRLPTLPD